MIYHREILVVVNINEGITENDWDVIPTFGSRRDAVFEHLRLGGPSFFVILTFEAETEVIIEVVYFSVLF